MLRLGPAIQAIDAATAPSTSSPDNRLDRPGIPNPSAYTVNACDAPEVSSRVASGTATEIAIEPSMYITKTSSAADRTALKYERGRPLRCLMWTALTSRPAKATKVPTTRAMLDSPSNGGVTAARSSGRRRRLAVDQPGEHEEDQREGRDDGAQADPDVAQPGGRLHPLRHHERGQPEPHQDDGAHVEAVAGQVRPAERGGERRGAEGQQRGVEGDAVHEDEPGRLEAGAVPERLADPHEDAALVAGRQLGRDQPHGEQEQHRRDQVDGDRRPARRSPSPRAGRCSRRWRPSSSPARARRSCRRRPRTSAVDAGTRVGGVVSCHLGPDFVGGLWDWKVC